MAITRDDAEAILVKRTGNLLNAAGLDNINTDGTNTDLNDPIAWAVRQLGGTIATVTNVVDGDLAAIGAGDYDQFFDLAEYRTLENILGNLAQVDLTVGPRSESFSDLTTAVEKRIERKRKQLKEDYSFGLGTLEVGVLALDYQQTDTSSDL